jgi:deazaflavin-dependent oxidoreductase (nitroreductase family)
MRVVHLISLIARVALMVTLTLGLVFWIAQLFGWIGLLVFLAQIGFVVVASNGGQGKLPNWWLNLRESKQAQIEIGRKRLRVRVQQANPEERQRLWPRVIAYHAGHEKYQQRTPYPLPLVIFHPEETF